MYNPALEQTNPIRALKPWAIEILKSLGTDNGSAPKISSLIELQLGNPLFEQSALINQAMHTAIDRRPLNQGYDAHAGTDADRKTLALIIAKIMKTPDYSPCIDWQNITLTNGATLGINAAMATCRSDLKQTSEIVLLSSPGYPAYPAIAQLHSLRPIYYRLSPANNYFFDAATILSAIEQARTDSPRLFIYNYPHNPTGATPDRQQARQMADAINTINELYPDLIFVEEILYQATISGIAELWNPYAFLSTAARDRTILVGSGSKLGLAGARAGFIFCTCPELSSKLANYTSLTVAGSGYIAASGYLEILKEFNFHQGQRLTGTDNPRFQISNFFQERIQLWMNFFRDLAEKLGINLSDIVLHSPTGGMYLWVDFAPIFKGRAIPVQLQKNKLNGVYSFQTTRHLQLALLQMAGLGYSPVLIPEGDLFGECFGMKTRISCVARSLQELADACRTIRTIIDLTYN